MAAALGTPADSGVGRFGHGLGLQLTEHFSNNATDETPLVPGVTMTLEPSMMIGGDRMLAHEEDIVITEQGARWLSLRAPRKMLEIHVLHEDPTISTLDSMDDVIGALLKGMSF
mmetsp:Transcript_41687/g.94193  ORF Transcript_41687/g.94193 Transcript_41687/m.94193 type:complete len:114 (+) Transcript_41687:590-931(+)